MMRKLKLKIIVL